MTLRWKRCRILSRRSQSQRRRKRRSVDPESRRVQLRSMQPKPSRACIRSCATAFFEAPFRVLSPRAENSMPFINGKFYMNPAYGRAIERARRANEIWSEELPPIRRDATSEPEFLD